jgi:hypothetical protein
MAEVVLFHHAQGLTPGVVAFAEDLRAAGHTVHTADSSLPSYDAAATALLTRRALEFLRAR